MPRVRARERRALRYLGRTFRTRAPQVTEASGLISFDLRVTAVVVAHNGGEFLPETLEALDLQTRPADFVVGVDTGSTDDSASILQLQLPTGSPVVGAPPRAGFGAAVSTAVAELPAPRAADASGDASGAARPHDWLWLLHDDSAPEPTALAELLLAVERAPSVTVAGAKQVAWDNPRELVDVGLSISRWAERLTLIDVDEHDQGQYDARSDVFAVNSAGMLVRRDVWDELGGFDPALSGVGDDLDLCWRNRLAGHRVVVVPGAVLRHAVSRPHPLATARAARSAEVYLRLKHAVPGAVPFLALGAVAGGIMRLLLGLLAKDPAHGAGQLLGSLAGVLRPLRLRRSRRSAARTRRRPRSIVKSLTTSRREVWSHRRSVVDAFTSRGTARHGGDHAEEHIPSGDSNDDFAALTGPARLWIGAGAVAAAVVLLVVALIGLHRYIGAPALAGGALLPVADSPGEVWESATTWWSGLGTGLAAHGSPFSYVLWLLALLGFGSANTAVVVLVILALPLSGLAAWFLAGALTASRGLRLWASLFWGAAPALQVVLGSGRLGALVAHILLPLALLAVVRAVGAGLSARPLPDGVVVPGVNGTRSWTAAAAGGLVLALITASAPSLLPLVVPALVIAAVLGGRRTRHLWWTLLPAIALNLPYLLSALDRPRGLLGDTGVPVEFDAAMPWQQLLGFPVAFDPFLPPTALDALGAGPSTLVAALLIGGPVVLLAAAALFLRGARTGAVRVFWLLAVTALALAVVAPLVPVAVGATGLIGVFPGPLVSVVSLGLLAAALSGLPRLSGGSGDTTSSDTSSGDTARRSLLTGSRARRRTLQVAGGAVLLAGPLLSLALWAEPQLAERPSVIADPVLLPGTIASDATPAEASTTDFGSAVALEPVPVRPLPATAADRGNGPEQTRTLVITVDDDNDVAASLMRGSGTTLDALNPLQAARSIDGLTPATLQEDGESARILRGTVAVVLGATGADPRADLRDLGVGFVVLRQSETAGALLDARIDSVPGLTAVGDTDAGRLWRVVPRTLDDGTEDAGDRTARVRVVDDGGRTQTVVPSEELTAEGQIEAGADGRTLVLAEEADARWQATLDGERLDAATDGWQQAFILPAEGGTVRVSYDNPLQPWAEVVQVVVLALTALLAIPLPARRRVVRPQRPGTGSPSRRPSGDRRAHQRRHDSTLEAQRSGGGATGSHRSGPGRQQAVTSRSST